MSKLSQKAKKTATRSVGVIGIDEVGRGPLAGPVTVCAVYLERKDRVIKDIFRGTISDSKKINKTLRFNIYQTIRQNRYSKSTIIYALSSRSAAYIDRYGISKATASCVRSCITGLHKQGIVVENARIYLDAGLRAPEIFDKQKSFIKGDEKFVEIALASIMAKEWRDAYMKRLSKKHSAYGWERNAGYGTKEHREAIVITGITTYHRRTYLKGFKLLGKAE